MADTRTKDTAPTTPKAPGPGVVEALSSSLAARFTAAALQEARAALADRYRNPADLPQPRTLTPSQEAILDVLDCLGAQLVTATTVPAANGNGAQQ